MENEYYAEQIRINISNLAYKIIQQDMVIFSSSRNSYNLNGFINKIIYLYIEYSCEKYEIVDSYTKLKGDSYRFRLNYSTSEIYSDNLKDLNIKFKKYPRATLFFKGILETYARLSFAKREQVILQDFFDGIERAMTKNKLISLKTKKREFKITPYKIVRAREGTFSYLIGFDMDNKIKSIRLSHILSLSLYGKSNSIPKDKLAITDEILAEYGATFAEEPIEEIEIKFLTNDARIDYEYSVIHRPIHAKIINEEENIYLFLCSLKQAEYFFFRFAGEVEILKPKSLRDWFAAHYKKGFEANK